MVDFLNGLHGQFAINHVILEHKLVCDIVTLQSQQTMDKNVLVILQGLPTVKCNLVKVCFFIQS